MTLAAMTPAARTARQQPTASSAAGTTAVPGHRRGIRTPAAPRSPRRVSGPTGGRAGAVTAPAPRPTRPTRAPRPATAPRRAPAPRRIARRSRVSSAPLGARVLARIRALPDHPLLDKLIRGRAWIPVLGVMLAGIVAMQVEVLKLGASMGRAIERGTALQSTNELLRASVATLADDQRIERIAASRGMVMPSPAGVGFLSARSAANAQQAVTNIHAPSPTSFMALTTANGAVATIQNAGLQTAAPPASGTGATSVTPTSVTPTAPTSVTPTAPTSVTPTAPTSVSATGTTGAAVATAPASTQTSGSATTASASGGAAVPSGG
jgi:hypothetical protein